MYIPMKIHKKTFCRLHLVVKTFGKSINKPTNQNLFKVPKIIKPTNKKT